MKAFVINLQSVPERMEFQRSQLGFLGISYERISAVSVGDLSREAYERDAFAWQRPLRKVEVACFLSHLRAWEKVLEYGEPALILEDDAILASVVPDLLGKLEGVDFDYVSFETRARMKWVSKDRLPLNNTYSLATMVQDRCGAAGYVMSPRAAEIAIAHYHKKGAAIADAFLAHLYHWKAYQLIPAAIVQVDCARYYKIRPEVETQSSISENRKPKPASAGAWIRFKSRRVYSQLRTGWRILTFKNAEKLDVGVEKANFSDDII